MPSNLLRFALPAFFLSTSLLFAAIPPAENLLPADTLAFFCVPDCAAARVAAKSSPHWMFWGDPAMKPFHDKLVGKWNDQFVAPLERDLGLQTADFMDLPQGQFTLAITFNGSAGHDNVPPGYLMLLDAKGKSGSLKTNLAALTKKWADAGRPLRTETFHGLAFTVVPLSSNDFAGLLPKKTPVSEIGKEPEKPEKPGEIYFTQFESLLVAGNSPKVVEPVAAHLTGGGAPAIADNPVFAADKLSEFRGNPEYCGWFNGKGFFDLVNQSPADGDAESPSMLGGISPAKAFGALGLAGMKSASFALHETGEGTTMTVHITAHEADRTGLLKILALAPKDAGVPPFVPPDAIKFNRYRLDGRQAWAELQKMVSGLSPAALAALNATINMANSQGQRSNPGFDIRNDLFGNLGDDIITYQQPVTGDSLTELADPPTLYLIAVYNPDTMINAIRTLLAIGSPQDSASMTRDFLGRKIYVLPLRPAASAGGTPQRRSLYLSTSSGYLAISKDSSIVEDFLRSAEGRNKSLRDNAGVMNAIQHLGGTGGGLFGYENQRETMRLTFKTLQNTIAADSMLKLLPPAVREWVDFSLLPDYDTISKYFYISAFTSSANSDGITFKAFAPRPPGLN
jgi:hypothetical protein